MKVLYFDCFSGISGDMSLASLIDAGADFNYIESKLKKLPIDNFDIKYLQVVKKGVTALKVDVITNEDKTSHHHRHYNDIIKMINDSELSDNVKERAIKIFTVIGKAEAKVHNMPLEKIHFHEVGAIDSIVDIIGVCLALENLGIEQIYTSPIPLGTGQIKIAHGIYPIPTPATLEILKEIPIRSCTIESEMTTPTGAGIIAALGSNFDGYPSMTIKAIGYGAGTKDFDDRPNVLRAIIGEINEIRISNLDFHIHDEHKHSHHHSHHHPEN